MPIRDDPWPAGTPNWVDLMCEDLHAARTFYAGVLGWEIHDGPAGRPAYLSCVHQGRRVAGIGRMPPGLDQPTVWSTYLATEDLSETVSRVQRAGGTVLMHPTDLPGRARVAFATDPTGGVFGAWEAAGDIGFEVYNESGTVCWNELMTSDVEVAMAFYSEVFGFAYSGLGDELHPFYLAQLPGHGVIGGIGLPDVDLAVRPGSQWVTYFAVSDADATARRAIELGGSVVTAPFNSEHGRIAELCGHDGETFAIIDAHRRTPA